MSRYKRYFWPTIGVLAVIFCGWLLYKEVRGLTWESLVDSFSAIPTSGWLLAVAATLVAYVSLAEYDRIALIHLGRTIAWPFVMITSFTTYSLSHNVGASLLSGTIIRFRAYGSRGLSAGEIAVLVAVTSFTFLVGALTLGGTVMVIKPSVMQRFFDLPDWMAVAIGLLLLSVVAFYLVGSLFHFKPLTIAGFHFYYPGPNVVIRQLVVGPLELLAAAAIIYFCLPSEGNPGFITVVGVFVASFSMAIVSHAPGGLGVLEYVFLTGLDDMDHAQVLAALIVFRLFYLLLPFAAALVIVLVFERSEFRRTARKRSDAPQS
ncbi:MAG TPA: lysylphosphatidylglycerol synthase domain-containing protein [Bauldia sp.]|nr:lysylphosphatidylglycerol synthase domain-containing protein [Bauldia sp.]